MTKKTIIILSVVSTILSLVYIFLVYFGIIRYFSIQIYPLESYSKNYKNLDKASKDEKNRVIVSLSTSPNKIKKLKPVINSILDQTVRVDEIAISIPYDKQHDV